MDSQEKTIKQEKIDMHVHIGPDSFVKKEGEMVTGKEVTVRELLSQMDKNNVTKSVILALDIPGHEVKNEHVYELSKKYPDRLIPCACINPLIHADFGVEVVKQLKDFKLIKLMPPYQFFYPDDERLYPFYEECAKQKKALIFHTGTTNYPSAKLRFSSPLRLDAVAVDFPKLKILMAHSGDPWFKETADIMVKNNNIYADISGIILSSDPTRNKQNLINFFDKFLDIFPKNRLLYGSDWPFTRLEEYTEVLENYPFKSDSFVKNICFKNAEKFLEI